jgi:uncharacterized protein (TIGR03000 family)
MYSIVLMMALTNNGANPEAPVAEVGSKARYGNHLQTEQYRGRRRGCCGGGCSGYGGCSGGGGCYGGGGGRRGYAYDYAPEGYYAYDQAPGMQARDYQAFYAGPNDRDRDMPARLQVFLPPQARLTIDGTTTQQTGSSRDFETPTLRAGKNFTYTLRAEVPGMDGQPQTITKKVDVRAGMVTQTVMDPRAARDDRTREQRRPEEVRPPTERKDVPRDREDVKPPKEKERKDSPQQ